MITTGNIAEVTNAITTWLLTNGKRRTLVLVSGGSAGKLFAKLWLKLPEDVRANYLISLVDERYGPINHADSNWKLLLDLGVVITPANSIPVLSGLSFEQTAIDWGVRLDEAMQGVEQTIAFFGIGEDSHIAGIKPNSPAATDHTQLTHAYSWDDYERITTTPLLFPRLDSAIAYLQGTKKQAVVGLLESDLDPVAYPSQFIKRTREFTIYYQPD